MSMSHKVTWSSLASFRPSVRRSFSGGGSVSAKAAATLAAVSSAVAYPRRRKPYPRSRLPTATSASSPLCLRALCGKKPPVPPPFRIFRSFRMLKKYPIPNIHLRDAYGGRDGGQVSVKRFLASEKRENYETMLRFLTTESTEAQRRISNNQHGISNIQGGRRV